MRAARPDSYPHLAGLLYGYIHHHEGARAQDGIQHSSRQQHLLIDCALTGTFFFFLPGDGRVGAVDVLCQCSRVVLNFTLVL